MAARTIFESEHELFRESPRKFIDTEIVPNVPKWEQAGKVDKEMFRMAGHAGLLGMAIPEEYGGGEWTTSASTPSSWRR